MNLFEIEIGRRYKYEIQDPLVPSSPPYSRREVVPGKGGHCCGGYDTSRRKTTWRDPGREGGFSEIRNNGQSIQPAQLVRS
jgi:hypothetical protein